ncbi:hypothetical protein AAHC03_01681 [Spirometra sp. Aus1]
MQPSAPIEIQSKPFSVVLDTDADIEWVMQAINYGLTMPPQYWNIVAHSVHIYCDWLNCLLPADVLVSSGSTRLPRAIIQNPALYAKKILFSLCRFFTPRNSEFFQGEGSLQIFSLLNARPTELPDAGCVGPVEDIIKNELSSLGIPSAASALQSTAVDNGRWSLETYMPLATSIVRQVESVVYRSKILTPAIWSCLLEFGLAVNFSVLSLPAPVPLPQSLTTAPTSEAIGGATGPSNHTSPSVTNALNAAGAIGSSGTSNQSVTVLLAQPFSHPGVRGALQLDCLLLSMLTRIWLRGAVQQFPDLGYWEGLQWLFQLSRHRVATVHHWTRQLGLLTFNVLCQHLAAISMPSGFAVSKGSVSYGNPDSMLVRLPELSVYQNFSAQNLLSEMRPGLFKEYWFRILHLFGNPVDICHPSLVTHTAVFEQFRHWQGVAKCRLSAAFLPTIFHQAIRGLSVVVDLFLGISPSLSLLPTFLGVPTNLYGPIDVTEHFRYASIRTPEVFSTSEPNKSSELSQDEDCHQAGQAAVGEIAVQTGAARQTSNDQPQQSHARSTTRETSLQQSASLDIDRQSFASIVRSVGLTSQVIDAQELAATWLQPDAIATLFYNRPEVNSILKLVGSWLFEAASSGTSPIVEGMIISERTIKVDPLSFHVGRAEAVACLCRIFIYANKGQVSLEQLTRFYVCLIRALSLDPVCEFLLSTVLINCPDLFRCDLRAVDVIVPYMFNACRWVFRRQSIVRPEYISMALLRRAAIHQIISMVCLPLQLEGITFSDISPYITSNADQLTAKKLRIQISSLLLELLGQEVDSHNLRMLLSAAFTFSQTLCGQELPSESESNTRLFRSSSPLDDASEFHGLLLERIYTNLVERWRNDMTVSSFALEVLSGMSQSHIVRPNPDACKNCVRSICQFIASQCKREKKDHTRSVHSVIIHAYQCLASWLVAHAAVILSDPTILWSVIETTKLCIFGVDSQAAAAAVSGAGGNSQTPDQAFPAPSKRVSEAAEQLLSILLSSVGNFPTPSGLDSTGTRLTERHLVEMLARRQQREKSRRQTHTGRHPRFQYFWDNASLLMGLLEEPTNSTTAACVPACSTNARNSAVPQSFADPPSVLVVLRGDNFGRQVWSCKPRFLPRTSLPPCPAVGTAATASQEDTEIQSPVSFLESIYATNTPVRRLSTEPQFLPRTKQNIPLVQADKVMPTLEAVCPAGSRARSEVDLLKSVIAREAEREAETYRQVKERRRRNTIVYTCEPQKTVANFTSAHTLLSHLGYVPVNRLLSAPSYRRSVNVPNATSQKANPNLCGSTVRGPDLLCDLTPIASETPDFWDCLDTFDSTILRTTSTLLVFYVRKAQTTLSSVISNMASWSHFPKQFGSFVRSLGWPVDCSTHCGWAANILSRTRSNNGRISSFDYANSSSVKRAYPPDGSQYLMYWADVAVEFAAVCPSPKTEFRPAQGPGVNDAQSENSEAPGKVALLWLERWDDALWSTGGRNPLQSAICDQFACSDLILVNPLQNGLFRIGIVRSAFEAGPLFTGLVASPHSLGNLVRSTVVNIARRRQLASDSFQPPPIRRLSRFKEIACNARTVPEDSAVVTPAIPNSVRATPAVSTVELIRWSTE